MLVAQKFWRIDSFVHQSQGTRRPMVRIWYQGLMRRVVLPRSKSMLLRVVHVDGVRCCTIAWLGHNSLC